jgi:hypothetical protein
MKKIFFNEPSDLIGRREILAGQKLAFQAEVGSSLLSPHYRKEK